MKTRLPGQVLIAAGIAVAAAAIFAHELRLDPNPGWGQSRIAMLAVGACLVMAGAAWKRVGAAASWLAGSLAEAVERRFPGAVNSMKRAASRCQQASGQYWPAVPLMVFVLAAYVWFVSSGTWIVWDSPTRYYADLARGFARGKLHAAIPVDPGLLAAYEAQEPIPEDFLPGPLDLSFYKGKFYLYWGPVPALMLLVVRPIIQWRVGDLQLSFLFAMGLYLLQCLLALSIWHRWFNQLPRYLLWICILTMGLAGPVTFMLNNYQSARVYEVAVLGGQLFLLGGFLAASAAMGPPISPWRLALAGCLWGLAFGTRMNLAVPIAVLTLLTAAWIVPAEERRMARVLDLAAMGLPIAAAVAGMAWYNWARFGSITQTGMIYQLSGRINLEARQDEIVSPLYVGPNLYNYMMNPAEVQPTFPWLTTRYAARKTIHPLAAVPEIYAGQQITGLLYMVPFGLLAIIPVLRLRSQARPERIKPTVIRGRDEELLNWLVAALGLGALAAFALLLPFFWAAMRYMGDFLPLLMLLSSLGLWMGYQNLGSRRTARRLFVLIGTLLAVVSILNSTLIAISINDARIVISNWLAGSS